MFELKTLFLFLATAIAEIVGCYLPYLYIKQDRSAWLLIPAAASLALFAWLLTLHPTAAGRTYAAYGGVYIFTAVLWLWVVDGIRPTAWDVAGTCLEFRLAGDMRRAFIERYRAASGDGNIHQRLPAYALAYAAYRVGYATLAAEQLRGSADGARFEARAQAYRRMLVAELAPGAAVAWRR